MDAAGQRILVTGGGSGIGRAVAVAMAQAGARVLITGRRLAALEETVALAGVTSGELELLPGDVQDAVAVRGAVDQIAERFGGIDGVVNAAGIVRIERSEDLTDEALLDVLDTNLVGAFRVTREAGRHMLAARSGSIVHIGSLAGLGGFPGRLAYAVSKHALTGLVRTLAAEWGPSGVRVNAVAPGFVRTPMNDRAAASGALDLDALVLRTPARRRAEPEEMVGPIQFLLSPAASFVTGEILLADGGWRAQSGLVNEYSAPRQDSA